MAIYVDPVCGMKVDEEKVAAQSTYEGKDFYFCCAGCKAKFDANPRQYVSQKAAG